MLNKFVILDILSYRKSFQKEILHLYRSDNFTIVFFRFIFICRKVKKKQNTERDISSVRKCYQWCSFYVWIIEVQKIKGRINERVLWLIFVESHVKSLDLKGNIIYKSFFMVFERHYPAQQASIFFSAVQTRITFAFDFYSTPTRRGN